MYRIEFYGMTEKSVYYLICRKTGNKMPHADCINFLASFNTELELARNSPNSFIAEFNNENDYNAYLNFCTLMG